MRTRKNDRTLLDAGYTSHDGLWYRDDCPHGLTTVEARATLPIEFAPDDAVPVRTLTPEIIASQPAWALYAYDRLTVTRSGSDLMLGLLEFGWQDYQLAKPAPVEAVTRRH